ncbi:hypothetical protein Avbf_12284 [Armadillidium vulgare]|nr:hypothetical protein Avbf_12284 [Armadillidium vulgare]
MKFSACVYIEIFIIIAFGLSRGRLDDCAFGSTAADTFGNGALITCLLITPLLLICYLMGRMEIQETILELSLNFIFFIFLTSASIKAFIYWKDHQADQYAGSGLTMASFVLFAGTGYMIDTIFAAKNLRDAYYDN